MVFCIFVCECQAIKERDSLINITNPYTKVLTIHRAGYSRGTWEQGEIFGKLSWFPRSEIFYPTLIEESPVLLPI